MRTFQLIALAMLLLALVSACGAEPKATGFTTITPATLTSNDQIAQPTGPVVLSLTGKIGTTNGPDRLDFDMETLEKLGLIEFTVDDPYPQARDNLSGNPVATRAGHSAGSSGCDDAACNCAQ